MRLALFDLDHTLVPFDSGMAWLRFLAARGGVAADLPERYLDCCRAYVAGTLGLPALQRVALAPLARHRLSRLKAWREEFAAGLAIPAAAVELVARHRRAGAECCLVTATNDFVAAPFARRLGVDHLIASAAGRRGRRFTGRIAGEPCHGTGKVARVEAWLARRGMAWESLAHTAFYSDSASDLPLLSRVAEPVAVRPDASLRAEAAARGWAIVEDLADAR